MRNTKGVEVDTVDTVLGKLVVGVEEELLDALWVLGKGGGASEEPAVAKGTLLDIGGLDTVGTVKGMVGEEVLCSLPGDGGGGSLEIVLTHVGPVEGVDVGSEGLIVVDGGSVEDGVEIVKLGLVPLLSGGASVLGDLSEGHLLLGFLLGLGLGKGLVSNGVGKGGNLNDVVTTVVGGVGVHGGGDGLSESVSLDHVHGGVLGEDVVESVLGVLTLLGSSSVLCHSDRSDACYSELFGKHVLIDVLFMFIENL